METRKTRFHDTAARCASIGLFFPHLVIEAIGGDWSDGLLGLLFSWRVTSDSPRPCIRGQSGLYSAHLLYAFNGRTRGRCSVGSPTIKGFNGSRLVSDGVDMVVVLGSKAGTYVVMDALDFQMLAQSLDAGMLKFLLKEALKQDTLSILFL